MDASAWADLRGVPGQETFVRVEPVNKGWSRDSKYYLETAGGEKRLLRVADIAELPRKQRELETMRRIAALGIPMSQPLHMGVCGEGRHVFLLLTWCEGREASLALPALPEGEQYRLGLQAGDILRRIHALEVYPPSAEWGEAYGRVLDDYVESYKSCGMAFEGDALLLDFVHKHRGLVKLRPRCLTHGDFHTGNLIVSPEGGLFVIDFQRCGVSDPYRALSAVMFSADVSPCFATGQLRGYFGGEPPADFWPLLRFYLAAVSLHALPWSARYGRQEIDFALRMNANILRWFDRMNALVPAWYLSDAGARPREETKA